ncbi:DNA-directed RNA polymerase subunit RPC12/RpoP [Allocatelliglobosispora scoriae]|uniref:DNA-directed RNA polymerase subunit RPC12/RpoP n=1 Tax=Allocatelliglobosispora scoriae TaxID=643052 RepID=A0A841BMI7_9ACTN|nr:hypothetical protein [Allocatelliglobosispora scoriae]MBB5868193.1 DNA-directed RNA polymerase subunit RPC12/RpoP [Allocatelliglobosispora scoriae]
MASANTSTTTPNPNANSALDGKWVIRGFNKWWDKHGGTVNTIATVVSFMPIPGLQQVAAVVSIAGSGYSAYRAYKQGDRWGVIENGVGAIPGVGALAKSWKIYRALKVTKGARCPYCGQRGLRSGPRSILTGYRRAVTSYKRWDAVGYVSGMYSVARYAQSKRHWND